MDTNLEKEWCKLCAISQMKNFTFLGWCPYPTTFLGWRPYHIVFASLRFIASTFSTMSIIKDFVEKTPSTMGRSKMMCFLHHPPYGKFGWWCGGGWFFVWCRSIFSLYKIFPQRLFFVMISPYPLSKRVLFFFIEKRPRPPFSIERFIIFHRTRCGPSFHKYFMNNLSISEATFCGIANRDM